MNKKILTIVSAVLFLFAAVLCAMAMFTKTTDGFKSTMVSLHVGIVALLVCLVLEILSFFGKKTRLYVVAIIFLIMAQQIKTQAVVMVYPDQMIEQGLSPVLTLALDALFIVSLVFADRDKKWAKIIVVVLLSYQLLDTVYSFDRLYTLLKNTTTVSVIRSTYVHVVHATLAVLIAQVGFICHYAKRLYE